MHFSSTIFLSLLPLASSLPSSSKAPQKRTVNLYDSVYSGILDVGTSVATFTTAVNNFDGSLLGVIPQSLAVVGAETAVDANTRKVTALTKLSSNFTEEESTSIVTTLATQITPIEESLTAVTDKYEEFKKTLESPIVLLDLKILKAHTDDLIAAVKAKVTESNEGFLDLGQGLLDQAFDAAIAVYGGS